MRLPPSSTAAVANAKNCGSELLSKKDVDGGLIGGASLKAPDFAVIGQRSRQGLIDDLNAVSAPGCAASVHARALISG